MTTLRCERNLALQKEQAREAILLHEEQEHLESVAKTINALYDLRCKDDKGACVDPISTSLERLAIEGKSQQNGSAAHSTQSTPVGALRRPRSLSQVIHLYQRLPRAAP